MATTIELDPDVDALIASLVDQGAFTTAAEAVNAELRRLRPEDEDWLQAARAGIAEGRTEIANGEGRPAEEVFAQLEARYRHWPR